MFVAANYHLEITWELKRTLGGKVAAPSSKKMTKDKKKPGSKPKPKKEPTKKKPAKTVTKSKVKKS
jgi:hypothetical protein